MWLGFPFSGQYIRFPLVVCPCPLECFVEAVELREGEFAVAVVLGACGLRLRVRVGSRAAACVGRRHLFCCCRLIGAVQSQGCRRPSCTCLSWRRGGAAHVAGYWRSLPGSQTC